MFHQFLDPKNDFAFKRIFGTEKHKDILIHFLNDILGFSGSAQIQGVEFLSTVQDPEIASKKQSTVDVLCRDMHGNQYIIEMQVAKSPGFEKRAQYYAAKAYGWQAQPGDKYLHLKAVIFIAIADCILFPNKGNYLSDHVILDKNTYEHDLKDFSFTFIELPKFKKTRVEELSTIIEKWCYFFKYAAQTTPEELKQIQQVEVLKEAYEALNLYYLTEQELISYEQSCKYEKDAAWILEGKLEEANTKGLAAGMAQGQTNAKLEIARKLLTSGMSLNLVAEATGLSLEDIKINA